jgi:hypothetical protein
MLFEWSTGHGMVRFLLYNLLSTENALRPLNHVWRRNIFERKVSLQSGRFMGAPSHPHAFRTVYT